MLCGGEICWLTEGLKRVDKKLERISELNELLAFRPWIISSRHIETLVKGEEKDFKLNWSIPEILQASSILASYHALCGLIFG